MPLEAIEPRRLYRQIADQLRQLIDRRRIRRGQPAPDRARAGRHAGRVAPDRARGADRARGRRAPAHPRRLGHLRQRPAAERGRRRTGPDRGPLRGAARARVRRKRGGGGGGPQGHARGHRPARLPFWPRSAGRRSASSAGWRWTAASTAPSWQRSATSCCCAPSASCSTSASTPISRSSRGTSENDSTWRAAHVEHVAIRNAIAAHHPAAARDAMREHLERSHRRFSRDFGESPFVRERQRGQARLRGGGPAARQGRQSVQDTQRAAQSGRLLAIDPGLGVPAQTGGKRNGKD